MVWRRIWQKKSSWISRGRYACPRIIQEAFPAKKNSVLGFTSSSSSLMINSRYYSSDPASAIIRMNFKSSLSTRKCWFSTEAFSDSPQVDGVIEVPLAQTGEGIAECELLKWFVKEGDQVEEFQPLCEVQSDKASIEITSRYKGKVSHILFGPGDIVKVGETLLKLVSEQSQESTPISDSLNDNVLFDSDISEPSPGIVSVDTPNVGRVLSTPVVRHLAKEYGININDICGTGRDGRVLKEDVLNYASKKGLCESPRSPQGNSMGQLPEDKYSHTLKAGEWRFQDETLPLRGFQRSMVKSMTMAAKVPHFHYVEEINCDALVELKAAFKNDNSDPDIKHTYLPFLIKSLSMALTKHPLLNSSLNEELYEVTLKGSHNIGVAMATPSGLVVPNIKRVQSLSILEITKELSRLQQLALNNKLSTEDIYGGTITLSNIGSIGGKFGSPILNLPEVAILAIGKIQKLPRFGDDGSIYPASIINVNIGADHRVVDGASVARFCNEWKLLIEKPELLLLHMR